MISLFHPDPVKSLGEIEAAIGKLSVKQQKQLVKDLPALCPSAFPADPWDAIIRDPRPRPALSALGDKLDEELRKNPGRFPPLTKEFLRDPR